MPASAVVFFIMTTLKRPLQGATCPPPFQLSHILSLNGVSMSSFPTSLLETICDNLESSSKEFKQTVGPLHLDQLDESHLQRSFFLLREHTGPFHLDFPGEGVFERRDKETTLVQIIHSDKYQTHSIQRLKKAKTSCAFNELPDKTLFKKTPSEFLQFQSVGSSQRAVRRKGGIIVFQDSHPAPQYPHLKAQKLSLWDPVQSLSDPVIVPEPTHDQLPQLPQPSFTELTKWLRDDSNFNQLENPEEDLIPSEFLIFN